MNNRVSASQCKVSGCNSSAFIDGYCHFHSWVEYRATTEDRMRAKYNKKIDIQKRADERRRRRDERGLGMIEMYNKGYGLRKISDKYGVTYQRIGQILKKTHGYKSRQKIKKDYFSICKICGKKFAVEAWYRNKKYCHDPCVYNRPSRNPEEQRRINNERHRKYYNEVMKLRPEWKERQRKYNIKNNQRRYRLKIIEQAEKLSKLNKIIENRPDLKKMFKIK